MFQEVATRASQNNVWVMSAEIPYWWCVSTQVLVVLLIDWNFLSTNQFLSTTKIWVVHIISLEFLRSLLDVILRGSSGDLLKRRLFSQATLFSLSLFFLAWVHFTIKKQSTDLKAGEGKLNPWNFALDLPLYYAL